MKEERLLQQNEHYFIGSVSMKNIKRSTKLLL